MMILIVCKRRFTSRYAGIDGAVKGKLLLLKACFSTMVLESQLVRVWLLQEALGVGWWTPTA